MPAYQYSYGSLARLFKVPAEIAGPVCDKLRDEPGGLTPKRLVDASRSPTSPLHNEFEWDDTTAAERYRENQASCVIRHIKRFEIQTETIQTSRSYNTTIEKNEQTKVKHEYQDRAFVSTGENNNAYVRLDEALSNAVWKENLLNAAKKDMLNFVSKYHRLTELAGVIDAIHEFLDEEAS